MRIVAIRGRACGSGPHTKRRNMKKLTAILVIVSLLTAGTVVPAYASASVPNNGVEGA